MSLAFGLHWGQSWLTDSAVAKERTQQGARGPRQATTQQVGRRAAANSHLGSGGATWLARGKDKFIDIWRIFFKSVSKMC